MGDDAYRGVNLNFAFPFYDRTFNRAYMYDNGVVSFLEPGTPDALPPWSWNSQPIASSPYKYFIAPLWADLAPVGQTTYSLTGTATTNKFTWTNIAEYYSTGGVLRLNTFSVELNASGAIDTSYTAVNLQTSNVSVGLKGDQDYEQVGWYPFGVQLRSLPNWSRNVNQVPTEPEVYTPPAVEDPVVQPEVVATPTAIVEPVVAAMAPTQPTAALPTPVATTPQAAPQTQPQAGTPVAEVASTSEAKVGESKEKKTAARGSSSSSSSPDLDVLDAALAIAAGSAAQSLAIEQGQGTTASAVFGSTSSNQYGFNAGSAIPGQLNIGSMLVGPGAVEQGAQRSTGALERRDGVDLDAAAVVMQAEQRVERKAEQSRPAPPPPAEFGPVAPAFTAYTALVLQDVAFYAPKEIYRGQRVVDNARALRQLGNDKRHQDLVDLQYRR